MSFSSSQHVQATVKDVEFYCSRCNLGLPIKAKFPYPSNFRLEADLTPEITPTKVFHFPSLFGVLRWVVELGRLDLAMMAPEMDSIMSLSHEGRLNALFQMFSFLKSEHN